MSDAHRSARFRRRPDVRYRVVGGQAVVIVQDAGEAIVLNETGTRVLELVDQGLSSGEVESRLADEYAADMHRLAADIEECLADLEAAGILERITRTS